MDFDDYQKQAYATEQEYMASEDKEKLVVPLLGLAGEAGELLAEFKKKMRDGVDHLNFDSKVKEELGDLLWYIANIATKFNLSLSEIAKHNLAKTHDRWGTLSGKCAPNFDSQFSDEEQIPRKFSVKIFDCIYKGEPETMGFCNGVPLGDRLTDNVTDDDGYRFHDAFHLAYAAVLGWSPVTRYTLGVKRKSDKDFDQNQDGGRAIAIEEGISALVYSYAENHHHFTESTSIDYSLLRTIKDLTAKYEVRALSSSHWQRAIILGFEIWRQLNEHKSGLIHIDLDNSTMQFDRPLTAEEIEELVTSYPEALKKRKADLGERKARLTAKRKTKA